MGVLSGAGAVVSVGAGGAWVVGADSSSVGGVVWARAGKLTAAAPIKSTCFNTFILLYRSEEHTSELQSLMRISYAVFCLKKQTHYRMDMYRTALCTYTHTN